jgi:hypothetical protein
MPPRIADWLIRLFAPAEQGEAIAGDLIEEFSQLVQSSGIDAARRWYWREAIRTAVHLAAAAISTAPWKTAAAVAAGVLLSRYLGTVPEKALLAVMDRYQVYENHFEAYRFFSYDGLLICHVLTMAVVGCLVALAAKGREMVSTLTLALVQTTLVLVGFFVVIARTGHWGGMPLAWMLSFPAAVVAGGVIVRTRRMKVQGA